MQSLIVLASLVSKSAGRSKFPAIPPWKKIYFGTLVETAINYVNFVKFEKLESENLKNVITF